MRNKKKGAAMTRRMQAQEFKVKDWADAIAPTIEGLNDSRRQFSVCGYDPHTNILEFCVSDAGQTTNQLVIALNIKTGTIYLWTKTRNAYGYRYFCYDTARFPTKEAALKEAKAFCRWKKLRIKEVCEKE